MRKPLFRRLASTAVALGLTSAALLGSGIAPAQAAVGDCPTGYFCAWADTHGTGSMFKTNASKASLGTWDNKFRLVINRSSLIACTYEKPNYEDGVSWYENEGYPTSIASTSVSSVKMVPTLRECETDAYPYWSAETSPTAATFGDMNGDRTSDVLVRDLVGRLWFLPGDGTGRKVGSGGWNAFDAMVRHGDFSRDGREDVITREKATGKLWLYPGTGTGGLGARKLIGAGGWNAMSRIAAFGDLTGDAKSDLLAVERSTGRLWLYPGTSTGTLGARKLIGNGGWNGMNALTGVGDMNGDGRADLYAREASTGKLWLYPGKPGALGSRVLVGSGGWNAMTSLIANGDWSGDGKPDLIATGDYDKLLQYEGTGTGGLRAGDWTTGTWWLLNGAF
ncbi:FG-GAP-like repeat-containing protein [Streptomyces narbonensis]|uniref:FG-GAP-like repeat-containing protein n=1 Tax=Streptomyces narbonensis TaxID=67333 RepID=UPI00167BEE52|nr:FG-GAP-like repeat-containing protein [Streptomyces narbonensis]GGW12101.1 ATP/GTP-binding protein [Streptomyces narbonensis]